MNKYKILWIDDKWEEMDSFKDRCELPENGMEVITSKYSVEGMKLFEDRIDEWSGIILDAKVLKDKDSKLDQLAGFRDSLNKIHELAHRRRVPYYVFTGQPDTQSGTAFAEEHEGYYYEKDCDEDKLIADIIRNANELPEIQLAHKYWEIFSWLPSELYSEVLDLVRMLENGENRNADVFNNVRKILDWLMKSLSTYGILAIEFNGSNLNDCSKFLSKLELEEFVPQYMQRQIHSCCTIANEGSHRLVTDDHVRKGVAPFMVRSTVYELLNILMWYHQLPQDDETKRKITNLAVNIINVQKQDNFSRLEEYEGKEFVISQDDKNNFHCGQCRLSYKEAQNYKGRTVILYEVRRNKLNYPFVAKFKLKE